MTSTTRRAGGQTIRNQALPAATASPGPQLTHPQPPRLNSYFEADFKPCSYGFRPNRRAHDAIAEIHHLASEPANYRWVFEADIKACFGEIDQTALMDRLRVRIKDKRIWPALVKAFLKSGVLTELGEREETRTGTGPPRVHYVQLNIRNLRGIQLTGLG